MVEGEWMENLVQRAYNCTNKRRISRFANYMERAARSQKTWDTVRLSPIFCNSDWEAV